MPVCKRRLLRVAHRTVPLGDMLVLDREDDLADAAVRLGQTQLGRALALGDGAHVGLLSVNDLAALLKLRASGNAASDPRLPGSHRPVQADP